MKCEYHADEAKVANVRKFVRFAGDRGLPDGSVVDSDGCLWNAEWGSGVVRRYTPRGAVDCTIAIPTKNPTCVVFGGSGLNELYVTSSRQELSLEELERAPHSGGVYKLIPGPTGISMQNLRIPNFILEAKAGG